MKHVILDSKSRLRRFLNGYRCLRQRVFHQGRVVREPIGRFEAALHAWRYS